MKNLFLLGMLVLFSSVFAQNKQVLYGWDNAPQSLLLNPGAVVENNYHFGIPFLSQLHLSGGSSGVTAFDIFADDGRNINTKIQDQLFKLSPNDFFTVNQQLELVNFGWKSPRSSIYFSGGIYQELDFIAYYPRDFAVLAFEGNRDYLGTPFNFNQINVRGDVFTTYHFGVNKQITNKLTAGIRVKLYSSMLSVSSVNNRGTFTTTQTPGTANIYEHTITDLSLEVKTSGYASLRDLSEGESVAGAILGNAFLGGNLGVGFDIGGTYKINKQLEVTASILDVGAIFHTNDTENYRATGNYTLDGIELLFPELENGAFTFPYYDNLEDEIEREIPIDTLTSSYSQLRPTKINAGLHYNFGRAIGSSTGACDCRNMGRGGERVSQAGLQYFSIFRPLGMQHAGTIYYRRRFGNWLSAKATYTIDAYSATNIGAGISLDIGNLNVYIAADNLLDYGNIAKANNVSLQLGFQIIVDE